MRKITANIIYPVSSPPIKDAYLVIDDGGKIIDIVNYDRGSKEIAGLEYYSGVLIPGFINTHCHLELSHLKGKIEEGRGLSDFIKQVQSSRIEPQAIVEKQMQNSLRYLWSRGINGLGDVVNSPVGVDEKVKSAIKIHNFIELFNQDNKTVQEVIEQGESIQSLLNKNNQNSSVSPHSTYGTSVELLKQINEQFDNYTITSLHFLESKMECSKAVDYILELSPYQKILLVHNIYMDKNIFNKIKSNTQLYKRIFWVLNPNYNMFIKSELPPIYDFVRWGLKLCLGTDSLASNKQLSILDEMKTIVRYFPEVSFSNILKWATLNGAEALGFDKVLGSFSIGKAPGVLLLSNFDFRSQQITKKSTVKRLV